MPIGKCPFYTEIKFKERMDAHQARGRGNGAARLLLSGEF